MRAGASRGGGGGNAALQESPGPSPEPSSDPSPPPVATYAQGPAAGSDAAAGGAYPAPAVAVGGYAVDVALLQQNAKAFKQAGVAELNGVLSTAVAQAKSSFSTAERKLLECASRHAQHACMRVTHGHNPLSHVSADSYTGS